MDFELTRESKLFLLKTAKEAIRSKLFGNVPAQTDAPEELSFNSGCFVTLHLRKRLRGCIGNFREDMNIVRNVEEMAVSAAFSDPRFGPVSRDEFMMCDIEISVLSPMTPCSADEIKVGRDGIYIVMGYNRGVLLPQVATEHGWNETEFLEQTCVKAGLDRQAYRDKDAKIYRFEALVFGADNLY
ncbi:MAG: AmmeMemoRadiSam system protein A [Deferribacterales bacterium]